MEPDPIPIEFYESLVEDESPNIEYKQQIKEA
jgi:hypothetical protein